MASEGEPNRSAVGITHDDKTHSAGITDYCAAHNLTLAGVHASEGGRQDAIDAVCDSQSVLVAESLACIADTMLDVVRMGMRLKDAGADLVVLAPPLSSLESSPGAILELLAGMGDLEYHRLADRLPYGYAVADDLVHIIVDAEESVVIRQIVEWHSKDLSPSDIADRLNAGGTPPRRADTWSPDAVRNVIENAVTSRWDGLE